MRGEPLPRSVKGESPRMDEIPVTRHRSTLGVVEITRGCGRGCQFCGVAVRRGRSIPLETILLNVRANVANGADTIMLTTEDLFLFEQGPRFQTNTAALVNPYKTVAAEPGARYIHPRPTPPSPPSSSSPT